MTEPPARKAVTRRFLVAWLTVGFVVSGIVEAITR